MPFLFLSLVAVLTLLLKGYVLDIVVPANAAGAKKLKPKIVIVLDRSGSMGQWCQRAATACIPEALLSLGYVRTDRVVLVTFDTKAERVKVKGEDPTIADMPQLNVNARGSTNMVGVLQLLREELTGPQATEPYHIIVLSDGGVGDQQETASRAGEFAESFRPKFRLSCSLIRFLSSSDAAPDTRALTCIGLLANNNEKTALMDVSNGGDRAEVGIANLRQAIVDGCLASGIGNTVDIVSPGPLLRTSPTAEPSLVHSVGCGQRVTLLLDEPVQSITIGSAVVPVVNSGVPSDVNALNFFVDTVGASLKMALVASGKNVSKSLRDRIDATLAYFDRVQGFLGSVKEDALENKSVAVASRAKALAKTLASRAGSCIDNLRQQLNADRVAGLNAQQTADWLRNADAGAKTSKNLAKRTEGADYEGDSRQAIRKLATACAAVPLADDDTNVSFYSQSGFSECVRSCQDLADQADSLTLQDWMQCTGGVGVPFEAYQGNYVDCWSFRVAPDNLFCGQFLAEPDLWLTYVQAQSKTATLLCPGRPDKTITGVVVLRDLNATFYDLYMKQGRALAEMQVSAERVLFFSVCLNVLFTQCSAMMRKMVACVPYDVIALNAACAWSLLGKAQALTSLEKEVLASLRGNMTHLIGPVYKPEPFAELFETLKRADVRPYLTGDLNVTNILKCVAVILRFAGPGVDLRAALRAMFQLEAYQTALRVFREGGPQARKDALAKLLRVDFATHATPLAPLFQPEPEHPAHYETVEDLATMELPAWSVSPVAFCHLHALVSGEAGVDNATFEAVFGCSAPVLTVVACAQAMACASESERVDTATRKAVVPDCLTTEQAVAYLKSLQRDIYKAEYEGRVARKRQEEHRVATERLVAQLFETPTIDEFVAALLASPMTNREHSGYPDLLERLAGPNGAASPARLPKLALLITGRDIAHEARGPVWANGNFAPGDTWKPMEKLFSGQAEKAWKKILRFHEKYGVYKYPKGNAPNRHKHSDERPSFFALGFKSLYDMQQKVAPEVFAKYVQEHCVQNQCCMPQVKLEIPAVAPGNNNNNNAPAVPQLARPQKAQEKTDAKRARRKAAGAAAPAKGAAKGARKGAKAAPAKTVPPKAAPSKGKGK